MTDLTERDFDKEIASLRARVNEYDVRLATIDATVDKLCEAASYGFMAITEVMALIEKVQSLGEKPDRAKFNGAIQDFVEARQKFQGLAEEFEAARIASIVIPDTPAENSEETLDNPEKVVRALQDALTSREHLIQLRAPGVVLAQNSVKHAARGLQEAKSFAGSFLNLRDMHNPEFFAEFFKRWLRELPRVKEFFGTLKHHLRGAV